MNRAIWMVLAIVAAGCGGEVTPTSNGAATDECTEAAAHVRACGVGVTASADGTCDRDAARQLLGLDCAALAKAAASAGDAARSDDGTRGTTSLFSTLDSIACATGIVRLCPTPACTAPAYPAPSATCSDYIDIAGCG